VPFQTAASDLHDFFILAGTASATLVGLLFVGLSLHLKIVIAAPEVRSVARVTLANFGAVLFVSLFLVIHQDGKMAALELIGAGISTMIITMPSMIAVVSGRDAYWEMRRRDRARMALRFALSGVGYLALIAAGTLLLLSRTSAFEWTIVVTILILLLISLRNTWDLLVTVEEATSGSDEDKG
jgi:hypothetical protein